MKLPKKLISKGGPQKKLIAAEDVIREFLKGRLPTEHKNDDEKCEDVSEIISIKAARAIFCLKKPVFTP